jgi:dTDP-4-amino-4,6-dideoxygalactose transaminase
MAAVSFHETKNVMCGEGGALLINNPALTARAELIWEKGTNRRAFQEGLADKYTWVDLGSSFYPSEISAAFLWAQLERADAATAERLRVWNRYHEALAKLEEAGRVRRPVVPPDSVHNAHMYYLLLAEPGRRPAVLKQLNAAGINAVFHYVPLHTSPAGWVFGRTRGPLPVTEALAARLIRLPLWIGLGEDQIDRVVAAVREAVERL